MGRSLEILEEACGKLPRTVRKMFGGYGFFAPNGGMFAGIVTDDAIVLKLVRGSVRDEFMELGGTPWVYDGGSSPMTMHEWLVIPDGFYDDFELLGQWLEKAHRVVPPKVAKKAKVKKAEATKISPKVAKKANVKKAEATKVSPKVAKDPKRVPGKKSAKKIETRRKA